MKNGITVKKLIEILSLYSEDLEVFVDGEVGWYPLKPDDVEFLHVYRLWHSDWDGNGIPYEDYSSERREVTYKRTPYMGHTKPDYVCKTVGEADIILLG